MNPNSAERAIMIDAIVNKSISHNLELKSGAGKSKRRFIIHDGFEKLKNSPVSGIPEFRI